LLLIIWCAIHRVSGTLILIHENVFLFHGAILVELLGDLYTIVEITAEPSHAGFTLLRRFRKFHIMLRKTRARFSADVQTVYNGAQQAIAKHSSKLSPIACLLASAEGLLVEENYVRSLRRLPLLASPPEAIDWTYLLTSHQQQYLDDYVTLWRQATGTLNIASLGVFLLEKSRPSSGQLVFIGYHFGGAGSSHKKKLPAWASRLIVSWRQYLVVLLRGTCILAQALLLELGILPMSRITGS